jgi:hypothetical protein
LVGIFLIEPIEPDDSSAQELRLSLMLQCEDCDGVHTTRHAPGILSFGRPTSSIWDTITERQGEPPSRL